MPEDIVIINMVIKLQGIRRTELSQPCPPANNPMVLMLHHWSFQAAIYMPEEGEKTG